MLPPFQRAPMHWQGKCISNVMSASHMPSASEIQPERWILFLAEFTQEYRGAHARLEVLDPSTEVGRLAPIEDRPFEDVSADVKDRERTVWATQSGLWGKPASLRPLS